jgi:hypothetical protein
VIRGYFNLGSGWPVPWVRVNLFLPGHSRDWQPVEFLLDTGASVSCLHPLDAVLVGIEAPRLTSAASWARREQSFGVGGAAANFVTPARYAFERIDEPPYFIDSDIRVAQLTRANQRLPSLLGWDVLKHFALSIDQEAGEVTLRPKRP